jgi:hypothetical protein
MNISDISWKMEPLEHNFAKFASRCKGRGVWIERKANNH